MVSGWVGFILEEGSKAVERRKIERFLIQVQETLQIQEVLLAAQPGQVLLTQSVQRVFRLQ